MVRHILWLSKNQVAVEVKFESPLYVTRYVRSHRWEAASTDQ